MATPAVDQVPLVFCNTLHLVMQPGADTVAAAGGLHSFTGRKNAIITDSGGFQIFSLAAGEMDLGGADNGLKGAGQQKRPSLIHKISEDGVVVRSYLGGGELYHLSPESSVAFQKKLGGDIIVPLDEVGEWNVFGLRVVSLFSFSSVQSMRLVSYPDSCRVSLLRVMWTHTMCCRSYLSMPTHTRSTRPSE
jgi:tRNA-guanine family transglycosylase